MQGVGVGVGAMVEAEAEVQGMLVLDLLPQGTVAMQELHLDTRRCSAKLNFIGCFNCSPGLQYQVTTLTHAVCQAWLSHLGTYAEQASSTIA